MAAVPTTRDYQEPKTKAVKSAIKKAARLKRGGNTSLGYQQKGTGSKMNEGPGYRGKKSKGVMTSGKGSTGKGLTSKGKML